MKKDQLLMYCKTHKIGKFSAEFFVLCISTFVYKASSPVSDGVEPEI